MIRPVPTKGEDAARSATGGMAARTRDAKPASKAGSDRSWAITSPQVRTNSTCR